MQYMCLVVLSEEEKKSVLMECHNNPGTGNHNGARGTRNRVVAGYYWPTIIEDTNEWDERTNQNIKRTLRKYVNENHDDWDVHLPAVYGINTAKQHSTRHTPYFLLFHRHPRLPAVINACPMNDEFEVVNPEEDTDIRVQEMTILNETLENVLDQNRPPGELLAKEGNTFWSLGLAQCMESTIGNACLKIVGEAAQKREILDMFCQKVIDDQEVIGVTDIPEGETLPPRCPTKSGSDFAPSNSARYALIGRDVILEDTPPFAHWSYVLGEGIRPSVTFDLLECP
ncbi:uncharacterized protein V6R79_018955 [Siganus canaliculatus]